MLAEAHGEFSVQRKRANASAASLRLDLATGRIGMTVQVFEGADIPSLESFGQVKVFIGGIDDQIRIAARDEVSLWGVVACQSLNPDSVVRSANHEVTTAAEYRLHCPDSSKSIAATKSPNSSVVGLRHAMCVAILSMDDRQVATRDEIDSAADQFRSISDVAYFNVGLAFGVTFADLRVTR